MRKIAVVDFKSQTAERRAQQTPSTFSLAGVSEVPTAVEAALAAGLTAAGVDAGVAVSAVLLFRIVTFWIPIGPGWLSFNYLQRRELL